MTTIDTANWQAILLQSESLWQRKPDPKTTISKSAKPSGVSTDPAKEDAIQHDTANETHNEQEYSVIEIGI